MSFAQERLWTLDRLSPGTGEYQLGYAWRISGKLDRDAWDGLSASSWRSRG